MAGIPSFLILVLLTGCTKADLNGQVRLVGGQNTNEGRVEVFYNGRWGTVCADSWDDDDAMVVCRQLGFPSGDARAVISTLSHFLYTSAEFGQGTGPVWLDGVSCSGSENRLDECRHNGWGIQNCHGHYHDAGVICNDGKGKAVTPLYKNYVFTLPCLHYCTYKAHVFITTSSRSPVFAALSMIDFRGITGYEVKYNNITRDLPASIRVPHSVSNNVFISSAKQNSKYKTFIVRASDDVSVYVIDSWYASGDAFSVLPTSHLGTQYYIASYNSFFEGGTWPTYPACFIMSSIYSGETSVNITTPTGQVHQVMLQQYQNFRFNGAEQMYDDLSGTHIRSDKPIAVLSGTFAKVPSDVDHEDGLLEQLPPVHNWGYRFILTPFLSVNSGYVYRVYTAIHSATLQMSDGNITQIAAESFHEEDVTGDIIVSFTSDQPIMVVQYMKGYSANVDTGLGCCRGNPSMFIVPPTASFTNIVTFLSFQFASCNLCYDNHYTSVIIACDYVDEVFLDESPMMEINSINVLKTPDQSMFCLRTSVSAQPHTVYHTNPMAKFYVTVYGMHHLYAKSYAFTANGFETATYRTSSPATNPMLSQATSSTLSSATSPMLSSATNPMLSPTTNPTLSPATSSTLSPATNPTLSPATSSTLSPATNPTLSPTTSRMLSSATDPTSSMLSSAISPKSSLAGFTLSLSWIAYIITVVSVGVIVLVACIVCYRKRDNAGQVGKLDNASNDEIQLLHLNPIPDHEVKLNPVPNRISMQTEPVASLPPQHPMQASDITYDKLRFVKELGSGQFGTVWLAETMMITRSGMVTKVAVKTAKEGAPPSVKEDLMRELNVMRKFTPHPNIIEFLASCVGGDSLYIIIEYMARGTLRHVLQSSRQLYDAHRSQRDTQSSLSQTQLMLFGQQVATGMEYVTSKKCVHRDLAARNVLVSEDLVCKVSDFGLAREEEEYHRKSDMKLPLRWMSIESWADDIHTKESDVWSFGILLWEIVTLGARPYPGRGTRAVIRDVQSGFRMLKPRHCLQELYDIMSACWLSNPHERPSFPEIIRNLDRIIEMKSDYLLLDEIDEDVYHNHGVIDEDEKV
ncbi:uncharacterized protein [Amphiura filiformis]|uniref:uncharacterized protein isoform X2 n=1 Tax=Amphiura filiformis TaxID=82378 RepID=UPI003B2284E6